MASGNTAPSRTRIERDTLGEMKVTENAYWGAQTARAVENESEAVAKRARALHSAGKSSWTSGRAVASTASGACAQVASALPTSSIDARSPHCRSSITTITGPAAA